MVQTGQTGGVTSLFVRGGNSTANHVLIDGITANDVGGIFDFGTVSSTGLGRVGAVSWTELRALWDGCRRVGGEPGNAARQLCQPVLNYSGDAGNFHTYRNEAALSGAYRRLDYFGAFSRFDTSNALPTRQVSLGDIGGESRLLR